MPRDINQIISEMQYVVMSLDRERNELIDLVPEESKVFLKKSTRYLEEFKNLQHQIEIRDEKIKTLANKLRDFEAIATREITRKDTAIEELMKLLPKNETKKIKENLESSTHADKDSSWFGMLGDLVDSFKSKSHSKPVEAHKLDSGEGSPAAKHETMAGLYSHDHSKYYDIIPMNKTDLSNISNVTSNFLRDHLADVLKSLSDENISFLRDKYQMNSKVKSELLKNFQKLSFASNMINELPADNYRNIQTQYPQLPVYLPGAGNKPTRKDVALGLTNINQTERSKLIKNSLELKYPSNIDDLKTDAIKYGIEVPDELTDVSAAIQYFIEK